MQKGFISSLIFATIVAIFALKNGEKVLIDFIFTKVEVSQAIIIFASAILGAVTVSILGIGKNRKFKKEIKELNKKVEGIEKERNDLQLLIEENKTQDEKTNDKNIDDNVVVDENLDIE